MRGHPHLDRRRQGCKLQPLTSKSPTANGRSHKKESGRPHPLPKLTSGRIVFWRVRSNSERTGVSDARRRSLIQCLVFVVAVVTRRHDLQLNRFRQRDVINVGATQPNPCARTSASRSRSECTRVKSGSVRRSRDLPNPMRRRKQTRPASQNRRRSRVPQQK
jgi:hypothetical protein